MNTEEIFNCLSCEETFCNFCTKSEPYGFTCFGCGKSK